MTFEIREIDVHDEAALRAWWEVGHAASAERAYDAWPVWDVSRAAMPQPHTDLHLVLLGAWDGGSLVGTGLLNLSLLDNTHLAEVNVWVAPGHRRRGIGQTVLAELESRARKGGRRTVFSSVFAPVDADSVGSLFAAAAGYAVASAEENKLVDLSASPGWDRLDEEVAPYLDGYRVEVFEGLTPEQYVTGFCALLSMFMGEVPTGLEFEDAEWTAERLRDGEQRAIDAGRVQIMALAVAPDETVCGFTDLKINRADPIRGWVGGTLVLPDHRGQRLGLAMKLATHRRAIELFPDCAFVETSNAGVNAWMNAVNEQLGYRVVERCLDVQKKLVRS